jgi:hypothetical protein
MVRSGGPYGAPPASVPLPAAVAPLCRWLAGRV